MKSALSRREFMKCTMAASSAVALIGSPLGAAEEPKADAGGSETMPSGRIGNQEVSRLMLGGNLIGGYAHSRDLTYVSTLMRRYNTESKIRETLELAEAQGINCINTWVMQENRALFDHWKNGGKMKWFAQTRLDAAGDFSQIQMAVDQGAVGVHLTGDTADNLLSQGKFDKVGESIRLIRSKHCAAGVAAHDLKVIAECVRIGLDADFYQKTFHSHEYYSAPREDEKDACGAHDNSWCNDPQAVVDLFARIDKPWIAFKILAAGAIPPRAAFPYAFNSGADFILVGMFDWQIAEDASLARRVFKIVRGTSSKRTRPWYG